MTVVIDRLRFVVILMDCTFVLMHGASLHPSYEIHQEDRLIY